MLRVGSIYTRLINCMQSVVCLAVCKVLSLPGRGSRLQGSGGVSQLWWQCCTIYAVVDDLPLIGPIKLNPSVSDYYDNYHSNGDYEVHLWVTAILGSD